MKGAFLSLGSKSAAVALWATRHARVKHISAALPTGRRLQRLTRIHLLILILVACFEEPTKAVTLERVLQTTLDQNPAIQEA